MDIVRKALDTLAKFAATKLAFAVVLCLFVAQSLFLVFATHIGVPPDENNHIQFIQYYADNSVGPVFSEQAPTWNLGDKTREADYLYHYLASMIARLLPGESIEVYAIRIVSVIAAVATIVLFAKLLRRLGVSSAAILVAVLVLTNLPMVLMVSSAVNNDVFVWLGCVALLLLLMRMWQRPNNVDALLMMNIIVAGGLVKRTLLPVCFVFGVLLILLLWKKWSIFKKQLTKIDWKIVVLVIGLIISTGLFIERAGGNLYRYGTINPTCEQVQGEGPCQAFWGSKRKAWIDSGAPAEGNTWLPSGSTVEEHLMPLPVFVTKWLISSVVNVVNIQTQSWRHEVVPPAWLAPVLLILLLLLIGYGAVRDVRIAIKKRSGTVMWRLVALGTAFLVLMVQLYVNYASYAKSHIFGLALNGRYIIPALIILVGLACYYAALLLPRRASQILAIVAIVCILVFSGLLLMIRNSQLFTS